MGCQWTKSLAVVTPCQLDISLRLGHTDTTQPLFSWNKKKRERETKIRTIFDTEKKVENRQRHKECSQVKRIKKARERERWRSKMAVYISVDCIHSKIGEWQSKFNLFFFSRVHFIFVGGGSERFRHLPERAAAARAYIARCCITSISKNVVWCVKRHPQRRAREGKEEEEEEEEKESRIVLLIRWARNQCASGFVSLQEEEEEEEDGGRRSLPHGLLRQE